MRKILFTCIGIFITWISHAVVIPQELWINNGVSNVVDSPEIPYTAFNSSSEFATNNTIITIAVGDTVAFTIHNNDTLTHGFSIKETSLPGGPYILLPGETVEINVPFNSFGAYIYYDDLNYPHYKSLGAAGIIYVRNNAHSAFYWNMKEHDKEWNTEIVNGSFPALADFAPVYFTLNGLNNPETQEDPTSKITGNVGDTLIICMVNTGQMTHSIHLHGYHGTITYSSAHPAHNGREKDTFPVQSMEAIVLYIVPDKPGIYPVHDHNLVATSGNGIYANGMFQIIVISE